MAGKDILVVDDEPTMREALSDWLTDGGYTVSAAEDGEKALDMLARREFGVVVLDLRLPGKDGIQVLREAKTSWPELKVIIITAYPSTDTVAEAEKAGAVDYLPKPFAPETLEQKIEEILGPPKVVAEPMAPCQIACPLGEDIQRTNIMIANLPFYPAWAVERTIEIGDEIYEKNPLFMVCGYICGLCEKQCNYKEETGAVRRRLLKRFVADHYLPYLKRAKPPLPDPKGEKVALVGGGARLPDVCLRA